MRTQARRVRSTARWQAVRLHVLERDGYRCQIGDPGCTGTATEVDHVTPLAEHGAPYDPANLRAACARCNRAAGARLTNAKRAAAVRRPSRSW